MSSPIRKPDSGSSQNKPNGRIDSRIHVKDNSRVDIRRTGHVQKSEINKATAHQRIVFKEVFWKMIFEDAIDYDKKEKLNSFGDDMILKVAGARYIGAEQRMKLPLKQVSTANHKLGHKISSEKKCIPEIWPMALESLARMKKIKIDPREEMQKEIFNLYHRKVVEKELVERFEGEFESKDDEDYLILLMNLFAEHYLLLSQ